MQTYTNEELLASIKVVDDFFSEAALRELEYFWRAPIWKYDWKTSGTEYNFWGTRLMGIGQAEALENCEHQFTQSKMHAFLGRIWYAIRDQHLPGHELIRCAGAAYNQGADGFIHTDNEAEGYTSILVYVHPVWEPHWGGEIGYYTQDRSDLLTLIAPKPGRLLIAPGFIPHRPFAPGRNVESLRACLNYRSRPKKVNQ